MKSLYVYSAGYLYLKIGLFLICLGIGMVIYISIKSKKDQSSRMVPVNDSTPQNTPTAHLNYSPTAFTVDMDSYIHGNIPKPRAFKPNPYDDNTHSFNENRKSPDSSTELF